MRLVALADLVERFFGVFLLLVAIYYIIAHFKDKHKGYISGLLGIIWGFLEVFFVFFDRPCVFYDLLYNSNVVGLSVP